MSFVLTMQPKLNLQARHDGTGFVLETAYAGHSGHLKIGNVSVAFDDRNDHRPDTAGRVDGVCVQLSELHDDPVRVNNTSVHDVSDPAEKLLLALAADLGYSVEKIGG